MGFWAFNVMRLTVRLAVLVMIALALRAALCESARAQTYAQSPGERGDPYSPLGPQGQIQARYPLPQPQTQPQITPPPQQSQFQPPPPQQSQFQPPPGYAPAGPMRPVTESGTPPAEGVVALPQGDVYEPNRTIATVGSEFILYGDISGAVEQILAPVLPQVKTEADREELEKIRESLTKQVLGQTINTKLMYLEFLRTVEKTAGHDKLPEIQKNINTKMPAKFEEDLTAMRKQIATAKPTEIQKLMQRDAIIPRLAVLMRDNQAETLRELDAILRRYGSSLDKQVRLYGEDRLGKDTIRRQVMTKEEVSHQAMLDYFAANAADFAVPAKARFEVLSVKFANFRTRQEAWNMLAQMGNEVYFGAPFATIARKHSQEPNAEKGGQYDWTTQGSLASKEIDQAIFTLEPGKLSQIIEDDRGLHIVRVIERTEAGQVPFHEAQPKIKDAIEQQRREALYKKYVDSLRTKTQVWTIYDDVQHVAREGTGTSMR